MAVRIGNPAIVLGKGHPIVIQTMCNTHTCDEEESIKVNFLMMLFCLDGNLCLNFDDYASFCKFVKTHIGCSPQNCRNS